MVGFVKKCRRVEGKKQYLNVTLLVFWGAIFIKEWL
jgi:hypothetical protein